MISLTIIPNMMERGARITRTLRARAGNLDAYIGGKYRRGWRVVLGRLGAIAPEDWATTPVLVGDHIYLTPAVGAVAIPIGLFIGKLIVGAALSYGISYAAGKYLGKDARPVTGDSALPDSQVYGWDGIRSASNVGIPIPVIYGTHKTGGNFINAFINNQTIMRENSDGKDEQVDQAFMHTLQCLGVGPVWEIAGIRYDADPWDIQHTYSTNDRCTYKAALYKAKRSTVGDAPDKSGYDWENEVAIGDKIKVDGNPIGNLTNVDIWTRMGNDVQAIIPPFGDIHNNHDVDYQLLRDQPVYVTCDNADVQAVQFNFKMPACYKQDGKGGLLSMENSIDVYRREYDPNRGPTEESWGTKTMFKITAASLNEIRRSMPVRGLPAKQYEFKIVKTSADSGTKSQIDLYFTSWDEIQYDDLTYPGRALLGLRILATNQLSGSLSNIVVEVEGRRIQTYKKVGGVITIDDAAGLEAKCDNPVWCLRDLMLDTGYGLGTHLETGQIDMEAFYTAAEYCEALVDVEDDPGAHESRFALDLVMDSSQSAHDWLKTICNTFRCSLIWQNGMLQPIIEGAASPVQQFGMGSIKAGSFSVSFLSSLKRPNIVEIQFPDADINYERNTIAVEDEAAINDGDVVRKQTVFLPGITRHTQAQRMARFVLDGAKYITRAIVFTAAVEAVTCYPGQVIAITHDVPAWGIYSGRVTAGGAGTIKLDQDVTLAGGLTYKIYVRKNSTDALEEKTISSAAGTYAAGANISISGSWTSPNPASFDVYQIGLANTIYKPFRVTDLTRRNDDEVEIRAVEYVDVYSDAPKAVVTRQYSYLPDPRKPPAMLTLLKATDGIFYDIAVALSWNIPAIATGYGLHDRTEVYMSADGGTTYKKIADTTDDSLDVKGLTLKQAYKFKVRSVSKWGVASVFTASVSCTPRAPIPPDLDHLELRNAGNGNTFTGRDAIFDWWPPKSVLTGIHPAGQETYGAGTGYVDPFIKYYGIVVYSTVQDSKGNYPVLRREYVKSPTYTYSFDKNRADHGGIPSRSIHFQVFAEDYFGQQSVKNAKITVSNPVPAKPVKLKVIEHCWGTKGTPNVLNHKRIEYRWEPAPGLLDLKGFAVFVYQFGVYSEAPSLDLSHQTYAGKNNFWYNDRHSEDLYSGPVRIATVDTFMDITNLNYSELVATWNDPYEHYAVIYWNDGTTQRVDL